MHVCLLSWSAGVELFIGGFFSYSTPGDRSKKNMVLFKLDYKYLDICYIIFCRSEIFNSKFNTKELL